MTWMIYLHDIIKSIVKVFRGSGDAVVLWPSRGFDPIAWYSYSGVRVGALYLSNGNL